MSAGNVENLLARLYTDARFREAFLSDPAGSARAQGLDATQIEALRNIDRDGLELAARSYAQKRAAHGRGAGERHGSHGFWTACGDPDLPHHAAACQATSD